METARNFVGGSLANARVRDEIDVPDPATWSLSGGSKSREPIVEQVVRANNARRIVA